MSTNPQPDATAPRRRPPRPVVLCILDGWGWREEQENNAIAQAATPHYDRLIETCPHALLETSGASVGLPEGQMGNSEVGHMNIGAGRVVLQDLPRIDQAFRDGAVAGNPALTALIDSVRARGGICHIMGLLSPGGVHAHQDHMAALARILSQAGLPVRIHAFLDGRDTPPRSAGDDLTRFEAAIADLRDTRIATLCGRYYAMDRDRNWERTAQAYAAVAEGRGARAAPDAHTALATAYDAGETDEFVLPTVIGGHDGMADGDGLIMANFRADRARQILTALADPEFDGFERPRLIDFAARLGMVEYSTALSRHFGALFPPENLTDTLGEIVAGAGLTQLRIAETEKYAHVTFFLNGGRERVHDGEDRILVPSPKVRTYDLKPEMSAPEVTDRLTEAIGSGKYDLIVANYANPDMVGHTGVMAAAVKAVECIDACLGRLEEAVRAAGGVMLVTADHGNVEMMSNPDTNGPHTAHTTGPVPLVLVNADVAGVTALRGGRLADIAPTVLALMGLPQPATMTGTKLIGAEPGKADRDAHALA
jgi:2,3-bisphosphoglycerate-independent phosphoglycerate mutase